MGTSLDEGIISLGDIPPEEEDYRGSHRAPGRRGGAPLWDVTKDVYPDDIYTLPLARAAQYYGAGESGDIEMVSVIRHFRNRPKGKVKVYRAVPKSASKTKEAKIRELEGHLKSILRRGKIPKGWSSYEQISGELERLRGAQEEVPSAQTKKIAINPGDWVTLYRPYAKEHGESSLRGEYSILSRVVRAEELFTDGNSLYEWGWDPLV